MTGYSLHLHCIQLCITSGLRFVCVLACRFSVSFSYLFAFMCGMWPYRLLVWLVIQFFFAVSHSISILLAMEMNICNFFFLEFDLGTPHWCHYNVCIWIGFFVLITLVVFTLPNRRGKRKTERYVCSRCIQFFHISINKTYKIKVYMLKRRKRFHIFPSIWFCQFNIPTITKTATTKKHTNILHFSGKKNQRINEHLKIGIL